MILKQYESTEIDRKTWLHEQSGSFIQPAVTNTCIVVKYHSLGEK